VPPQPSAVSAPSAPAPRAYPLEASASEYSYLITSSPRHTKARVGKLALGVVLALIAYTVYAWFTAPSGPSSFVADAGARGRITIAWVDDGNGHLSGLMQTVSADPALAGAPAAGVPAGIPFTGTLREGHVSLVANAGLPSPLTMMGTVEGDDMTLKMIGAGSPIDFTRHTPEKTVQLGPWTWTSSF
jgi:hypothetical protein